MSKYKPNDCAGTAAANSGSALDTMTSDLMADIDRFSLGERLRLAAAMVDMAARDAVPERARLGWLRTLQIVEAVARDLKKGAQ
jgi:hypothetical protein